MAQAHPLRLLRRIDDGVDWWALGLVTANPGLKKTRWIGVAEGLYGYTFAFAIVLEVAIISAQIWRGVPSHFNESTPLDSAVFYLMGLMILYISAEIAVLAVASLWPLAIAADRALAVRAGLFLLLLGCVLGF